MPYEFLGGFSLLLLVLACVLSVFVLTRRLSRRQVYLISGTVLAIMVVVTVLCVVIYMEFGS